MWIPPCAAENRSTDGVRWQAEFAPFMAASKAFGGEYRVIPSAQATPRRVVTRVLENARAP
ncbi:hypothetical protein PQR34_47925 [Paraburkholderia sediminicola]|uniref:hypothetical protein n=1 Tax=Paraburkholderia sediminicola TaxID=458836 RepID=UPI0038B92255